MSKSNDKGVVGEKIAAAYLVSLGWTIVAANYIPKTRRFGAGEIDIIAKACDGTLVFCEVKFHRYAAVFPPITHASMRRRINGARAFLSENRLLKVMDCRFDVLFILSDKTVDHIQSAFIDEGRII